MTDKTPKSNPFQTAKTHCPHGHEYSAANTKLIKSTNPGRFKRVCRQCHGKAPKAARSAARLAKLAAQGTPTAPFAADDAMRCEPVIKANSDQQRKPRSEASKARDREGARDRARARRAAQAPPETDQQQLEAPALEARVERPFGLAAETARRAAILAVAEPAPPPSPRRGLRPFERQAIEFVRWRSDRERWQPRRVNERVPVVAL